MSESAGLTLEDILDQRAYERVREQFRTAVIARKRLRRVPLGPILTLVFECFDTVRFQIQEMARVEKIVSDEGIQAELDAYNPLLPSPGELSATLFIELTSETELRRWLPALVGIESSIGFDLGSEGESALVMGVPEAAHAAALTREEITAAVHYLRFPFQPDQVERFATGPVSLVAVHPEYREKTLLSDDIRRELLGDLQGLTAPLPLP
jgi:hypothetical protein